MNRQSGIEKYVNGDIDFLWKLARAWPTFVAVADLPEHLPAMNNEDGWEMLKVLTKAIRG